MSSLHHIVGAVLHIVAQIVEAEFVVGSICDITGILLLTFLVGEIMHNATGAEAQKLIDRTHPGGITPGEIIVHRYNVNSIPSQCVQVNRKSGHQRLAFAGFHFRNVPVMQNHAANKLHIEMTLAQGAFRRFAHGCKCRDQ